MAEDRSPASLRMPAALRAPMPIPVAHTRPSADVSQVKTKSANMCLKKAMASSDAAMIDVRITLWAFSRTFAYGEMHYRRPLRGRRRGIAAALRGMDQA